MTTIDELVPTAADIAPAAAEVVAGPRIGRPERAAAREALEEHLDAERLTQVELDQRYAACEEARTQGELLRVFADLPAPHPDLPGRPVPARDAADDDMPPIGGVVCSLLFLGLPVTVVLGFVYGAWWALAVPVSLTVVILYVEHLLTRDNDGRRESAVG